MAAATVALSLASTSEPGAIVAKVGGNADMGGMQALERFLKRVHDEAVGSHCRRVSIDLRELYFMNSSCLKLFVAWITRIQQLPETGRYELHFSPNPSLPWQQRSLSALRSVATELVKVIE